ncbi:Similar to NOF: 120.7 kDa protein in NOF-FB transposable element (Drosophila melanogaster) [Cotesia congregata]|uniref:Similar to NOF: 120.7 kDa protein in NOF-FB transposable element (Drosophila melanogaster) n=1 Tax=Cotesia congregata TaxID=51543 RepID=A0A8J2MRH3_COTCN|nr:Similar to NOF: 120.7 kDa protein in NOF-FB transposable element (Drosophila melanogaster) [Cotesia congregata]
MPMEEEEEEEISEDKNPGDKDFMPDGKTKDHEIFSKRPTMGCATSGTPCITLWLRLWIGLGAKPPLEAVSDGNRAQLNAMSLAFNEMSLKQYINVCFEKIRNPDKETNVRTFIRLDTAHFVHAFTGWNCFKSVLHPSIKRFYTYCFCLLIDCKDLDKFERILLLILIVCNTSYEDSIINVNGGKITPIDARNELENLISTRNIEEFFLNVSEQIEKFDLEEKPFTNNPSDSNKEDSPSISSWAGGIIKAANNQIVEGKKIQSFYLSSLVKPIIDVVVEFPLWTNICIPYTDLRAISRFMISLKHQEPLPTDAYTFLKLHLDYLIGGVNLFKLKVTKFVTTNFNNRTTKKSNLLNCQLSEINETDENNIGDVVKNTEENNEPFGDRSETTLNADEAPFHSNENSGESCTNNNYKNINIEDPDILNYNLSKITEEKNQKERYENWMGKGKDDNFDKFGWMNLETIEGEENMLNSSDSEQINDKYLYDEKVQDNVKEKDTINKITVSDDYTKNIDIDDSRTYAIDDDNDTLDNEVLKNVKVEKVGDHNYSFTTSTPLSSVKQKRTLVEAIEEVSRKKRNCGEYFQDNPGINVHNNFVVSDKKVIKKNIKYVLQNGFRCKAIKCNVVTISRTIFCQDNVNLLWIRLFANEPSLIEKNVCPSSGCKNNNTRNVPIFPINHQLLTERGFSTLDKALDFHSVIYNMYCNYCQGNKRIRRQFPNHYIYIELDIKTEGRECKLRDLPEYLNLSVTNEDDSARNLRYRLCGVAGYSPGHYVAFCRRISGAWVCYSDLTEKLESKPNSSKVLPHGVLYYVFQYYNFI